MNGNYQNNRLRVLIKHPFSVKKEDSSFLYTIIKKYPYFQPIWLLYLRSIKEEFYLSYKERSFYLELLDKTAIYCTNRYILFEYINDFFSPTPSLKKEEIGIKKLSFSKWLSSYPSTNKTKDGKSLSKNIDKLIYIKEHMDRSCLKSEKEPFILIESKKEDLSLKNNDSTNLFFKDVIFKKFITETLAQTYLDQKKYDLALKAYEALMGKYPEKRDFFELKICSIKENINFNP